MEMQKKDTQNYRDTSYPARQCLASSALLSFGSGDSIRVF